MIDGVPVINAVAHAYNLNQDNARGPVGGMVRDGFYGIHAHFNPDGWRLPPEVFQTDQSAELLARTHFLESDVDLLAYHTLRLDSLFADGLCSAAKNEELARRWPHRVVSYVGVDPTLGTDACLRELDEQLERLPGAVGLKMYPDQVEPYRTFRMDDESLMEPIYQRCQDAGLTVVAVHKALPNGPVPLAPYRIDDVEAAAMTHPGLSFEIVHSGMAFVEETAYALARFPNVYANLEITTMLLSKAPRLFAEALATFLYWGGPSKIFYSDGALFTHPQLCLPSFWDLQLPEDLLERYHLPQLTREDKALMLSGNYARVVGLDLDDLRRRWADDEFGRARAERDGALDAPWTAFHAEAGLPAPAGSGTDRVAAAAAVPA